MTNFATSSANAFKGSALEEQQGAILKAVRILKYGSVEVVVHKGQCTEVTKNSVWHQRFGFRKRGKILNYYQTTGLTNIK